VIRLFDPLGAAAVSPHGEWDTPLAPALKFVAAVALRFDNPLSVGETPDGVRLHFQVHGTVEGPELSGKFPPCMAYLRVDRDGVGTINVRAPLILNDGAKAEMESTGRYDFGKDGYAQAVKGTLPNSGLGWCPRFTTGEARYRWLTRTQFVGVGELVPAETRVNYDLFAIGAQPGEAPAGGAARPAPTARDGRSLYDRLGGQSGIDAIVGPFMDAVVSNEKLHQQNPLVRAAHERVKVEHLKAKFAEMLGQLTGGPCPYTGRPLPGVHAPLRISEADWDVVGQDLVNTLKQRNVSEADSNELLAVIESVKPQIVSARMPTFQGV
jgi:hemoglobin